MNYRVSNKLYEHFSEHCDLSLEGNAIYIVVDMCNVGAGPGLWQVWLYRPIIKYYI